MGAEQSTESKRKEDEKYQRILKHALEQQRRTYEQKCQEMLQEQQKILKSKEKNIGGPSAVTQSNYAPLYPNLQQVPIVEMQASTTSAHFLVDPSNTANQNNSVMFQPSAPMLQPTPETSQHKQRAEPRGKANNDLFQCPSCQRRLDGNIFQCIRGHSSCNQCKMSGSNCGLCHSRITDTRNIELERLVLNQLKTNTKQRVICPNKGDGCSWFFTSENLESHLKECSFREMACPLASAKYAVCSWQGKINQMKHHFVDCHPGQTGVDVDSETYFNRLFKNYVIHYVAMGNFNFLVHVKLDENLQVFFMSVQLIGTLNSACKWSYEFHVYDKSASRRKFTYVDRCLPANIPFTDVSKEAKCAVLPLQYAMSFFKDNKLTYKFYITRVDTKSGPNQRQKNIRSVQSVD